MHVLDYLMSFHPLTKSPWISETRGLRGKLNGRVVVINESLLVTNYPVTLVIVYTVSRLLQEGEEDFPLPDGFIKDTERLVRNLNRTQWVRNKMKCRVVLRVAPNGTTQAQLEQMKQEAQEHERKLEGEVPS